MDQLSGEFWAAIAGAVVGGGIALGGQIYGLRAAKKDRDDDKAESRKALAYSLLFKMIKIASNLRKFNDHLKESFEKAAKDGLNAKPWQFVCALASLPDRITFSSDEMAMLLSLKDDELFNDLVIMDQLHNSIVDVFEIYGSRRTALTDLLPAYEMNGVKGSTSLNGQQMAILVPKMSELDDLIHSISANSSSDAERAADILQRLNTRFKEALNLTHELHVETPARPK